MGISKMLLNFEPKVSQYKRGTGADEDMFRKVSGVLLVFPTCTEHETPSVARSIYIPNELELWTMAALGLVRAIVRHLSAWVGITVAAPGPE